MSTANLADRYLEKTDLFPDHVSVNSIHLISHETPNLSLTARLDLRLMTLTPRMLEQI